jgi:hypothetical protein
MQGAAIATPSHNPPNFDARVDPPADLALVQRKPSTPWWRVADFAVFGGWIAVAGFTLAHHEKWADEAQAWLIARDLDLKTIWFHELRYEGSPGLWHTILWVAQHVFHAPYAALGVIGLACAAAGIAFMLWKAPFPRPLRYMLAFSYFMVYQYAVIARPYTLLPLLAFAAAYFFRDRTHPERMTVVLVLLALLSIHGIAIAAGIGLPYLIEAAKDWKNLEPPVRRRYALCVGAMAVVLIATFFVLRPTPDVDMFAKPGPDAEVFAASHAFPKSARLVSVISGALLDFFIPSSIFLLFAAAWCAFRRKLLPFLLPTALLILLYVFVHGQSHHHGTIFVAIVAGLWIAWPTPEEQREASLFERRATSAMVALLVCLFAINIWDAAVSIRYEYLYPYSGAEDAAQYLKSIGADQQSIFGYTYGMPAIQAYFDHNILQNIPTTYYHHGLPSYGALIQVDELRMRRPQYLVFLTGDPKRELAALDPVLGQCGYHRVHFSDGYLFFKRTLMDRQAYVVYRREP